MNKIHYTRDLHEATQKLRELLGRREELETEIAKQKRKVALLHELTMPNEAGAPLSLVDGLTDACRVVFRAFDRALLPSEIKERVQQLGIASQANLLASVHTTIRRMKEAGEIIEDPQRAGAYRWAGETVADRFRRTVAERAAVEEMRKAGSEIGTAASLDKERYPVGKLGTHTLTGKKR